MKTVTRGQEVVENVPLEKYFEFLTFPSEENTIRKLKRRELQSTNDSPEIRIAANKFQNICTRGKLSKVTGDLASLEPPKAAPTDCHQGIDRSSDPQ